VKLIELMAESIELASEEIEETVESIELIDLAPECMFRHVTPARDDARAT
jgi:hypothetical protein